MDICDIRVGMERGRGFTRDTPKSRNELQNGDPFRPYYVPILLRGEMDSSAGHRRAAA